jgi:hypothetical protein
LAAHAPPPVSLGDFNWGGSLEPEPEEPEPVPEPETEAQ